MGCGASSSIKPNLSDDESSLDSIVPKWRKVLSSDEARRKYEQDGSLPKDAPVGYLELRGFLDDPMLIKALGMFGKTRNSFDAFMCWVDIHEFKCIGRGPDALKRSKAANIFEKYIKEGAKLQIKGMDAAYIESIERTLEAVELGREELSVNLFDRTQQQCLKEVHGNIFQPFKYSQAYNDIITNMQERYNRAKPDDFEYIEVLGQGGFGLVVHCRKKSTGKHYALKMQTKFGLLRTYKNVLYRVDFEKQALAACCHPFIVTLDYAFQTPTLVFLAMQLGTAGTLMDALETCPNKQMSEDRVRFYMAEMVLALAHIHGLGMIYRDLKPQNVLLNADGHIQLVDLGGIIDPGGHVLGIEDESDQMLNGLFAKDYANYAAKFQRSKSKNAIRSVKSNGSGGGSVSNSHGSSGNAADAAQGTSAAGAPGAGGNGGNAAAPTETPSARVDSNADGSPAAGAAAESPSIRRENSHSMPAPVRARSIMGTDGYMAVEIMKLRLQKAEDRTGYTNAVDWWSLGVLVYFLLMGEKPYPTLKMETLPDILKLLESDEKYRNGMRWLLENVPEAEMPAEYRTLLANLSAKGRFSPAMIDVVMLLLDFNETTRLGSAGAGGLRALREHAVFKWQVHTVKQNGGIAIVAPTNSQSRQQSSTSNAQHSLSSNSNCGDSVTGGYEVVARGAGTVVVGHADTPAAGSIANAMSQNNNTDSIGGQVSLSPHGMGSVNTDIYTNPICSPTSNTLVADGPNAQQPAHGNQPPPVLEECWDKLELKQVLPPYIPPAHALNETAGYPTFEYMMNAIEKSSWLKQYPSSYYDEYFSNWDFISPHILKMEYGLANVMEQYETKYKARRLLGDMDDKGGAAAGNHKTNRKPKVGLSGGTGLFGRLVGGGSR